MKKLLIIATLLVSQLAMAGNEPDGIVWKDTPQGATLTGQGLMIVNCQGAWAYQELPVDIPRKILDTCDGYTIIKGALETAWYR